MAINKDFVVKHGLQVNASATFSNTITVAGNTTLQGANVYLTANLHVNASAFTAKNISIGNTVGNGAFTFNLSGNNLSISSNASQTVVTIQSNTTQANIAFNTNTFTFSGITMNIGSANLVANAPFASAAGKIGTNSRGNRTLTTTAPSGSGHLDGDIWYQY
jgi:hypothetical protein